MRSGRGKLHIAVKSIKNLWRVITLQTKNKKESEEILLDNYYITKVDSLEESGRQLTSVFAILIGAYLAILINDVCIIMIKNVVRVSYKFFDNSFYPISMAYILTVIPILPFIVGILLAATILRPENHDLDLSSKAKNLSVFLSNIIKKKYFRLKLCYFSLFLGIILLLIIFTTNILSPIYFSYEDAKLYYGQHKYDEAIKCCDKSIAEIPDFEFAWRLKGKCYYNLGNYSEAIKNYNESIRLNPNSIDAWRERGLAYLHLSEYDEAIKNFNQAIILNPKCSETINSSYALARYYNGLSLYHQGNYTAALMNFDQAIMLERNCSEIWFFHKGMTHESLKDYDGAIKAFDNATKINSSYALAWYHKGLSLYYQGNYTAALMNFDRAILLKQNCPAMWFFYEGMTHEFLKEYEEAIKAFDEAIRLDPNNAPTWHYKGKALKALGKTIDADAAFARADLISK